MYTDPYSFAYPDMGGSAAVDTAFGVAGVMLAVLAVIYLLGIAYSILVYVLHSLGLYTMAMRRGIRNPWLAWIPLGNAWMLGSISDQYQFVAKGQVRSRRKTLLGLSIATYALLIPYMVSAFVIGFSAAMGEEAVGALVGSGVVLVLAVLAMFVIAIVLMVFQYIAYYDLFASSKPGNAVVFLVLGILFNFLMPYFVFACRKHDGGMPPRKQPVPAQPVLPAIEPAEPVAEEEDFAEPVCEAEPQDTAEEPIEE